MMRMYRARKHHGMKWTTTNSVHQVHRTRSASRNIVMPDHLPQSHPANKILSRRMPGRRHCLLQRLQLLQSWTYVQRSSPRSRRLLQSEGLFLIRDTWPLHVKSPFLTFSTEGFKCYFNGPLNPPRMPLSSAMPISLIRMRIPLSLNLRIESMGGIHELVKGWFVGYFASSECTIGRVIEQSEVTGTIPKFRAHFFEFRIVFAECKVGFW